MKNKYIVFTGHSLGGTTALCMSQYLGIPAVVFNPGATIQYQKKYDYFKIRIHKITTDMICMFEGFSGQVHLYQLPTDNPNYGSKIGSHNLDNFL